jgi:hypothetical protein
MRTGPLAIAAALAVALAGCGAGTEDLMAIEVTGGFAGVHEQLRVTNDGRASCGGDLRAIPNQTLLDARGVKRSLRPLARRGASFTSERPDARHYEFRSFDGTVRWREGAPGPPAIGRATLLALRLERELCRRG